MTEYTKDSIGSRFDEPADDSGRRDIVPDSFGQMLSCSPSLGQQTLFEVSQDLWTAG